jgi:hypothetical protein
VKEYFIKTGYKISYISTAIILFGIMLYCLLFADNIFLQLLSIGFLIFSLLAGVAPFFDKLTVNESFVEVTHFFKNKRIYFEEITDVVIRHNQIFVKSEKKHIFITQDFDNWQEVADILQDKLADKRVPIT